ncbi:hypothetical protein G6F56_011678 [Rhizopus delemar]|nr:hypothetical protein G6F56_011678 [Rhizopus delemar]
MKRIIQQSALKVHVESDHLIMYGSSTESSGCVLRGAISLKLKKSTRCKSLSLNFLGKISVSWNQLGNGYERKFRDSRTVISHTWTFLSTPHLLSKGTHTFEFELVLPGNLPESTHIEKYYDVNYQLKASLQRPALFKDLITRRAIHLSRQRPQISHDFFDPVLVSDRFADKLHYEFSLPTKVYTYGDSIPVKIKTTPLIENLHIRFVSCCFKEYFICRGQGWFDGKTKSSRRLIDYTRKDTSHYPMETSWSTTLMIPVPKKDIQCDAHNESVRVWHTLSFHLSLVQDEHVFDIKFVSPIIIAVTDSIGHLPSYQESWQTLSYNPIFIPNDVPPSYLP